MPVARWKLAFQVGFTYIGTVVGAGFASGQEVLKFFTIYGPVSYLTIFLTSIMFGWLGMKIMMMGFLLDAKSYREFTLFLAGRRIAIWFDTAMTLMLFGLTVAMLAGVGALFQEQLHLPFEVGILVTAIITYVTLLRGVHGILGANSLVVPVMLTFTAFVLLRHIGVVSPWPHANDSLNPFSTTTVTAVISAISYTAFNTSLSISVLVPLGQTIADRKVIRAGSMIGALGLGTMLFAGNQVLHLHLNQVLAYEIPMAQVIGDFAPWLKALFIVVLWGEIYTTLIANVYGLCSPFSQPGSKAKQAVSALSILCGACLISYVGFSNIVTYMYPLFGYISLILLVMILWPRPFKRVP